MKSILKAIFVAIVALGIIWYIQLRLPTLSTVLKDCEHSNAVLDGAAEWRCEVGIETIQHDKKLKVQGEGGHFWVELKR